MSDLVQALMWLAIFGAGLSSVVLIHRLGVATTYLRDALHVGAGVWVLGWRYWHAPLWPIGITLFAVALTGLVLPRVAQFRSAVSDGDERYDGLFVYTISFAIFTFLATRGHAAAAATALWSLTLGDGLGGAVGRRFGRSFFRLPGGKKKSLEGSLAVALFAGAGAWFAAQGLGGTPHVFIVAITASVAEALAPRSSDNLIVPSAVYLVVRGLS